MEQVNQCEDKIGEWFLFSYLKIFRERELRRNLSRSPGLQIG